MIIFGTRSKSVVVAALFLTCTLCHAPAAQRLFRIQTWFTLFFVPIFPFGQGRYIEQCAYCGTETPVAREGAERFQDDAEAAQAQRVAHETLR